MSKYSTTNKRIIFEEEWYTPRKIAENRWVKNANGNGDYKLVLKLIHKGILRAKNFGLGQTPYYRIKGEDIKNYFKTIE